MPEGGGISQVIFAKIDTEGFDALILAGVLECLQRGIFDLIRFEYNWRWLLNSKSLRDIFQLIQNTPYRLGNYKKKSFGFRGLAL